jgi:DNA modification methylase
MNIIEFGDCRETMRRWAACGVKAQTCVTSPPYFGLRDYGHPDQLGLEQTPEQYIAAMVEVFRCVWDVLADDGTLWLNIGDSYASNPASGGAQSSRMTGGEHKRTPPERKYQRPDGLKPKDLIGIPWMLAFALRADGWYLRQDIIWSKPNPMPESVRDRCTKAHEYVFLLSKSERYFFDAEAIKEPAVTVGDTRHLRRDKTADARLSPSGREGNGKPQAETRNRRSVWTVATRPYKGAHFATFPPALIEPCILAGSRPGDVVLDPFMGSGTTAAVALRHGRRYVGCELNPEYLPLQQSRMKEMAMPLFDAAQTIHER